MKILQTPIEKLIPYIRNPRKNDQAISKVAGSIAEFGFRQPIIVDSDMTIIAGHTRLMAAQQLELKEVPVIIANDLTEAQVKAYRIADNRTAQESSWDFDLLELEMEDLISLNFDLLGTAFDQVEIDDMLRIGNEGLTDPDEVPDIPDEPTTELGDIYILGNHRLQCGDSTNTGEVERLMDGHKADMVFTDPPYGIEYQSNMRAEKFDVLKNDDSILDVSQIIKTFSKGWIFVWTSWKVQNKWIDKLNLFDYPTNIVVWHKMGGSMGDLKKTFASDYELALVWNRGTELCGKRIGSVWTLGKDSGMNYKHPTQKPVALAEEAINKTTRFKNKILDLFGGSGSTLIACEKTGRHCYMMELDPRYCDVIVKRWEDYTGQKSKLN